MFGSPLAGAAGHAAAGDVILVLPGCAPAGPDQQDVARPYGDGLTIRDIGELIPLDQILGRPPPGPWFAAVTGTPPNICMFSAWWQSASTCVPAWSAVMIMPAALVRLSRPSSWRRCSMNV